MESEAAHSPPLSAEVKVTYSCKSALSPAIIDTKSLKTGHILEALKILNYVKINGEF